MSPALIANICGFAGMFCVVAAYAYVTGHRAPNPFVQHGMNLLGAALLTVSLLFNMNPASLVLEFVWASVAIWGLAKAVRDRRPVSGPERLGQNGLGQNGLGQDGLGQDGLGQDGLGQDGLGQDG
jgi:hypothetical protein